MFLYDGGTHIRLKKLAATPNPDVPTPDAKDYTPGVMNGAVSLPIEYEVEIVLWAPVEVGKPIVALRLKRNGVERVGDFISSEVVQWVRDTENGVETTTKIITRNSVYLVEPLPPITLDPGVLIALRPYSQVLRRV